MSLRTAILRASTGRLAQQAPRAHCSKGNNPDTWMLSVRRSSGILQRYLMMQHIFSDRRSAVQFITVTFPLSGTAISPQQKSQAQTFQLKAGFRFRLQKSLSTKKKPHRPQPKKIPQNRTKTRLQKKKNHGMSEESRAHFSVMLSQGKHFIKPSSPSAAANGSSSAQQNADGINI